LAVLGEVADPEERLATELEVVPPHAAELAQPRARERGDADRELEPGRDLPRGEREALDLVAVEPARLAVALHRPAALRLHEADRLEGVEREALLEDGDAEDGDERRHVVRDRVDREAAR